MSIAAIQQHRPGCPLFAIPVHYSSCSCGILVRPEINIDPWLHDVATSESGMIVCDACGTSHHKSCMCPTCYGRNHS